MKKIIALILAMVMALSLVACGQTAQDDKSKDDANSTSAKTFIMGIDAEYPPFSYLDADGNYTGFDVEVCKAACDLLGWELQIFPVNWDQKLVQLDAKECDCVWSGMTILDSMKEAGYVLSTPYYDNTQVIMVKEGSNIKSSADLAGKVVAVQLGTSGEALLSEGGDLADLAATFGDLMTCDSFLKCFTELGGAAVDAGEIDQPPFLLNTRNRTLEKNGQRIKLTQVEYAIMKMFMENPGKALSREEILDLVWGHDYFGELKIVDVNIRRLRLKIEDNATNPTYITTIWGFGYKWGL